MSPPRGAGRPWVLLLGIALAARLAAGAWWQSHLPEGSTFGFGDSESYWQLGQAIAAGGPYEYAEARVFRTPGYPLLLAAVMRIGGRDLHVAWARALSAVCGTLAVGGVYWLTKQMFGESAGYVAGLWAALYPGAVALGAFVLSEAPFCAVMLLQLGLWQWAWRTTGRESLTLFTAAGLAAGAATLIRPSWLLFTPFALGCAIIASPERKRHALSAICLLAGLGLAMLPWWLRCAHVTGRFVPTTLQVGASLYDGLSPHATGASDLEPVRLREDELRRALATRSAEHMPPMEYRMDRALRTEAIRWAREHPLKTVQLAAVKLSRLWNVWPNEPSFRGSLLRVVILTSYVPTLLVGLYGGWKFSARGWPVALCLLPALYFTLLHVVFVASIRYRQPAMLPLIVLAAAVVAAKVDRRRTTKEA